MKRLHLDANVILRFLRNDEPVQSAQARQLFTRAERRELDLAVSVLTLAEAFYALRASYKIPRPAAARLLANLLQTGIFLVEKEPLVLDALERVESKNVDFGDAMLAAEAFAEGVAIASFDLDFKRFKEVKLHSWD
ncbi:MAG: PIN domain-containing protein [Candidatus Methylacidiphilales bacterium]|nr:PIN domain-containing protein [Candidatus Methylacidiphilales bacterium]